MVTNRFLVMINKKWRFDTKPVAWLIILKRTIALYNVNIPDNHQLTFCCMDYGRTVNKEGTIHTQDLANVDRTSLTPITVGGRASNC